MELRVLDDTVVRVYYQLQGKQKTFESFKIDKTTTTEMVIAEMANRLNLSTDLGKYKLVQKISGIGERF